MLLLMSKIVRSFTTNEFNKMPYKCYAFFYLPKSKNEVCDCIDCCKYNPPNKGLKHKIEQITVQHKTIYI